jgi:cytochrome c oxidase accessory protein FixG
VTAKNSPVKPSLLSPKRAIFQWCLSLATIIIPFIRIGGESLLRLDFGSLSLYAFGNRYPITDLSLFLLLGIGLTLLFLLVTLAFGRAWCGWACPQTSLVDFIEFVAEKIGVRVTAGKMDASLAQKLVMQTVYLFLSLLIGANLVWYFVSPYDFFPQVIAGQLHWVAVLTFAITAVTVYLDLAFLRRLFCKEFCPYGRFQTVLVDPGTLTLHLPREESYRCIECNSCVNACPMGIDIREGYQIECINCGRCLDACTNIMAPGKQPGLIKYTFGTEGKGISALLNIRMALVTLATIGVFAGLIIASNQRDPVSLKIGRNPNLLPRLVQEGKVANFYTAYLTSRSDEELKVKLRIANQDPDLVLSGADKLQTLPAGERKQFNFAVFADQASLAEPRPASILVISEQQETLAAQQIYLTGKIE